MARAEDKSLTDAVRTAIDKHIESRKMNKAFMDRLKQRHERERELYERWPSSACRPRSTPSGPVKVPLRTQGWRAGPVSDARHRVTELGRDHRERDIETATEGVRNVRELPERDVSRPGLKPRDERRLDPHASRQLGLAES
jgi:hypothetical protein